IRSRKGVEQNPFRTARRPFAVVVIADALAGAGPLGVKSQYHFIPEIVIARDENLFAKRLVEHVTNSSVVTATAIHQEARDQIRVTAKYRGHDEHIGNLAVTSLVNPPEKPTH